HKNHIIIQRCGEGTRRASLLPNRRRGCGFHTHDFPELVYTIDMSRTNIEINDQLVRKARKLTRLKTKREIVDKALELLVRSEARKEILRYYGSGIWKGDLRSMRRNRV
ncbi:MAG: type II toxin-antitoxin system VapB family antitoxin, partial [Candidatus Acidiferrales bacterium]